MSIRGQGPCTAHDFQLSAVVHMGVSCTLAAVSIKNFWSGATLACRHAGGQSPPAPNCVVHVARQPSRLVLTGKNAVNLRETQANSAGCVLVMRSRRRKFVSSPDLGPLHAWEIFRTFGGAFGDRDRPVRLVDVPSAHGGRPASGPWKWTSH